MQPLTRTLLACLSLSAAMPCMAATPATRDINACELLTSAEITAVIGAKVDDGRREDLGSQPDGSYASACIWMIRSDTTPRGRRFVILSAMQWPAGSDRAGTYLQSFRDSAEQGILPARPSPRQFGDEALWWGDGLAVRQGDFSFGISVFMPDAAANQPQRTSVLEEKLAPLVLSRIKSRAGR